MEHPRGIIHYKMLFLAGGVVLCQCLSQIFFNQALLQEWIDITREQSACIDPSRSAYDVALQDYEKGFTSARLDEIFVQVCQ